jgi:uncharacterized protein (DUF983 family)
VGWIPCGLLIFKVLGAILPENMMFSAMIIIPILWAALSLLVDLKISAFRCPRCENKYFKKGFFSTLRSNCSYCGLRLNESPTTEGDRQNNPAPEFDKRSGQFIPARIFGSIFLIAGAWIAIKGVVSLINPEITVTVNGIESTRFNDKIITTLFGLAAFFIGCAFAILPVKIADGANRIVRRIRTKLHIN